LIEVFFDTETTGFPNKQHPYGHISQPWVIQFAMIVRKDGKVLKEEEHLVNIPVDVPENITQITGLTKEDLQDGETSEFIYSLFYNTIKTADKVIGHNISFDLELMRIMSHRVQKEKRGRLTPTYICTMKSAVPICKIPGKYKGYKWPNLTEAYKIIVDDKGFEKAHTALADVKACMAVYDELVKRGANLIYD
jgi:DNA polymerase III epsilon subunit-like protein